MNNTRQKLGLILAVTLIAALLLGAIPATPIAYAQDGLNDEQRAAVMAVASTPEFADWLAANPGWQAWADHDDGPVWWVEFWIEESAGKEGDWLGWAMINMESGELMEHFIPRPLTPEQYAEWQPRVLEYVLADAGVIALLGDPDQYEVWVDYDRYEQAWGVGFYRGLDEWVVRVRMEEDEKQDVALHIDEIVNPNLLEGEMAEQEARNRAIALAYEAPGIDQALRGHDDWVTTVSPQGEGIFSVEFSAGGALLMQVIVDVNNWAILPSDNPAF